MKAETARVWHPLRKELLKLGWDHDRIENSAGPGMADVSIYVPPNADSMGKEVWVELKYVAKAPTSSAERVSIGLRPEQFIWLRAAKLAGRRVYLLARIERSWLYWNTVSGFDMARRPTVWRELESTGCLVDGPKGFLSMLT